MSTSSALRITVSDLVRRPGAIRDVDVAAHVADLATDAAEIPPDIPVLVTVSLERVPDGIVARGDIRARFSAPCSRCVRPVSGDTVVHVDELFERHPLAGETYGLDDDVVDLEPLVRDALLLELPAAPLCDPDCRGLCPRCGIDRNESTCDCVDVDADTRWHPLRSLEL